MTPDLQILLKQLIAFNGLVFGLALAARALSGRRLNPAIPAMIVTMSVLMILNLLHDRLGNTPLTEMRFVAPLLVGPIFLWHATGEVQRPSPLFPLSPGPLAAHLAPAAVLALLAAVGQAPYAALQILIPLHIAGYLVAAGLVARRGRAGPWTWALLGLGATAILLNIISILLGAVSGGRAVEALLFAVLLATVCALIILGFSAPAEVLRAAVESVRGKRAEDPDPEALRAIMARIEALLEAETPHLDPGFRLERMARRLGEPERRVSRAINHCRGLSAPDFLNLRRVEAVQRRLADPRETASLLEIALDCGFNSKATFNRAFARHAGRTPSQVRAEGRTEILPATSHFTI
ncbi:MAG: helix-turn-helix domain-containing protein [Caulobacter sp.]|nr:helix-turn-helix domain-containing protein [Caulobacter sp.]